MLQELVKSVIDSFVAPRAAARRVMDNVTDFQGVAIIFGLSFTLSAIVLLLKSISSDAASENIAGMGGYIPFVINNLIVNAVMFAITCGAVYGIGRFFGGVGSLLNVAAIIAWHSLILVVFSPFISIEALTSESGSSLLMIFLIFFALWIFANFIAEAHGFQSAFKVAAVMFGISFAIPVLYLTLVSIGTM